MIYYQKDDAMYFVIGKLKTVSREIGGEQHIEMADKYISKSCANINLAFELNSRATSTFNYLFFKNVNTAIPEN